MSYFQKDIDFGRICTDKTGTTDVSAELQTLLNTGKNIYIPAGIYKIDTPVTMQAGQKIYGDGFNSILKIIINNYILYPADNCIVENLQFQGTYDWANQADANNAIITTQRGIYFQDKIGININKCYFYNLGGHGFYCDAIGTPATRQYFSNIVSNCYFYNCNYGYYAGVSGEYVSFDHCHSCYNVIGARMDAGNVRIVGGSYSGNSDKGIWVGGTGNEGHSVITGCCINHNTNYNLYINGVDQSFAVTGCAIYYAKLNIVSSKGIIFSGNTFLQQSNIEAGASKALFVGNVWYNPNVGVPVKRPPTSDNTGGVGESDLVFLDNIDKDTFHRVVTSDSTPTQIYSYPVPNNSTAKITLSIVAQIRSGSTVSAASYWKKEVLIRKDAGTTTTLVGSLDLITPIQDSGLSTASLAFSISGTSLILTATGIAATTIDWKINPDEVSI